MRNRTRRLTALMIAISLCTGSVYVSSESETESEIQTEYIEEAKAEPKPVSLDQEEAPQTETVQTEMSEVQTETVQTEMSETQTEEVQTEMSEAQTEAVQTEMSEVQTEEAQAEMSEAQTEEVQTEMSETQTEEVQTESQESSEQSDKIVKKEKPLVRNEQGELLELEEITGPKELTSSGKTLPVEYAQGIYRIRIPKEMDVLQITVPDKGEEDISLTKWSGYLAELDKTWWLCPDDPVEGAYTESENTYTVNLEKFCFDLDSVTMEQLAVYGDLTDDFSYGEIFLYSEERSQILLIEMGEQTESVTEAITEALTEPETEVLTEAEAMTETLTQPMSEILDIDMADMITLAATPQEISKVYSSAGNHLAESAAEYTPTVASINGEWQIIGLVRGGQTVDEKIYSSYLANVENTLKEKDGVLHKKKYTEYSRVVLALTALGEDVTNVAGYNLLEPLADFDKTVWQGVNGAIFALLAFDSHDYEIPAVASGKTQTTRENLINHILSLEVSGGGWDLSNKSADTDMTAMAIQALAPYYDSNADVKAAVDRGVAKLSAMQNNNGAYGSYGTVNSESCSQVIVALTALGIDPNTDTRFVKNGNSVVDGLLSFSQQDGSFKHILSGSSDQMATEQAYYALNAYDRFSNGMNRLYDMTDVKLKSDTGEGNSGDEPGTEAETENAAGTGQTTGNGNNTTGNGSSGNKDKVAGGTTKKVNLVSSTNRTGGTTAGYVATVSGAGIENGEVESETESEAETEVEKQGGTKTAQAVTSLISDINGLFRSTKTGTKLPEEAEDYTDSHISTILDIYRAFIGLEKEDQKAVEESSRYGDYLEVLEKLREINHYDELSGTDLRDNEEEVLPWHVQLEVNPMLVEEDIAQTVKAALKDSGEILNLQDIHMVDLMEGGQWQPQDLIRVRIPMTDIGAYENVGIVHMKENGTLEFIQAHISGSNLEFDTDEFSKFGIIGFNGSMEELMEETEEKELWIYLLPGGAAALLLLLMLIIRAAGSKKKKV